MSEECVLSWRNGDPNFRVREEESIDESIQGFG